MKNFRETLKEQLRDSNFKKEFDNLEPEYQVIREMIKAREENNMTQVELSKLTGISQADISRLENGEANPTIEMLSRIAYAFGKKLELQFAWYSGTDMFANKIVWGDRVKVLETCINDLKASKNKLNDFDEGLFYALVDKVKVNKDNIVVVWKDGTES